MPSPIIDDYNRLAQAAGCDWPGHRLELFTTPADESRRRHVTAQMECEAGAEVICLNPGAAFGAAKHWSVASFARVAQDLIDQRNCRILVLCGPAERDLARQIQRLARRPQLIRWPTNRCRSA